MVRLGGRAKPQLAHLNLFHPNQRIFQPRRTKADWTMIDELKERVQVLCGRLEGSVSRLLGNTGSYEDILTHIEFEDEEYFEAFRVPKAGDGMAVVHRKGRKASTYLIVRWSNGQRDAGIFKKAAHLRTEEATRIWATLPRDRWSLIAKWREDIQKQVVDGICSAGEEYDDCQMQLMQKHSESLVATLKAKRIVACTTTGAAKFTEELRTAAPDVVLVEEAGEILESHILTTLGENTRQLILIGDHKYVLNNSPSHLAELCI
jgi:hypothetical protein